MAAYRNKMFRMFNNKVRQKAFNVGDLVLKGTDITGDNVGPDKLEKTGKDRLRS